MFERFTEEAREAMVLSNAELKHYGHEVIGTGHILLGLVEEGSGAGGAVLKKFGVGLTEVRKEFEDFWSRGSKRMCRISCLPRRLPKKLSRTQ